MKHQNGSKKIINKSQLKKVVNRLKKQNKKIVTTNGSFDILHAGHVYLLNYAKKFGNILIVGLNSDKSIKIYKSKDRPIISQKFRAKLLSSMMQIDYIYVFDEINPIEFLKIVKPDYHINSSEYGKNCIERSIVEENGGKLILLPKVKKLLSTTYIITKILKVYKNK